MIECEDRECLKREFEELKKERNRYIVKKTKIWFFAQFFFLCLFVLNIFLMVFGKSFFVDIDNFFIVAISSLAITFTLFMCSLGFYSKGYYVSFMEFVGKNKRYIEVCKALGIKNIFQNKVE